VDQEGYLEGAPELAVEIAASSASIDTRDKLTTYRRAGVREYLVWRTEDEAVDWWVLEEDEYRALSLDDEGRLRSTIFPGLWLEVTALLAGDSARVLAALNQGLQTVEHAEFARELERRIGGA